MRKPDFCICENKDADQLRGNCEADQRLCFRYIESTIPLLSKYEASVAERLSYPLCKPGVLSSIPGFSSLSDETLNRGPVSV